MAYYRLIFNPIYLTSKTLTFSNTYFTNVHPLLARFPYSHSLVILADSIYTINLSTTARERRSDKYVKYIYRIEELDS